MLIDFADYFSVNVFKLGHTFLRLSEALSLQLPLIDPSIYVPRYAKELHLGCDEDSISKCAIRLVARMKRDWIVTGRRPSGICGAGLYKILFISLFIKKKYFKKALIIASRLYGQKKTIEEISIIVHLSRATVRRR